MPRSQSAHGGRDIASSASITGDRIPCFMLGLIEKPVFPAQAEIPVMAFAGAGFLRGRGVEG